MKCYICDATLSKPRFNADHDTYEPCDFCLSVIQDTLEGFLDGASAPDDAFGEEPITPVVEKRLDNIEE